MLALRFRKAGGSTNKHARGETRRGEMKYKMKCHFMTQLQYHSIYITADDGRKGSTVKRRVLKHVLNVKFLKIGNCVQCLMNGKEVGGGPSVGKSFPVNLQHITYESMLTPKVA